MIFLILLLSSGLIFIAATPLNYVPMHYNIKLIPYLEENIFYGECNITIQIFRETGTINLYLEELYIMEVELSGSMQKLELNDREIMIYKPKYFYDTETHVVNLNFMEKLSSGNYVLNIKYIGNTADNGGFKIFDVKDRIYDTWVAATHFQTIGARRLFPCFDILLEATFNISMLHYHQYMIFSNMPVRETEIIEDNIWTHFDTTPVMSTHFIAAVMTQIVPIHNQDGTVFMWSRNLSASYVSFAYNVARSVTLYLRSKCKHSKSISKVDHVVIPDFEDKDMINLGLVLYREADIIYNEMIDSVARKIEIIRLVGHKVIQEWFCNIIHPFGTFIPPLNKAFGTFFGIYAANKVFSNYRVLDLFIVQFQRDLLRLDADYYMPFTLQNNELFESLQYIKEFIIMRILQHAISEEIFWKGVHFYANETNKHVATLLSSMSRAVLVAQANEKQEFTPNLLSLINTTIDSLQQQKHYPIIKIVRNYDNPEDSKKVIVAVQNFNTSKFCMPITFATEKYPNFDDTLPRYWLNKEPNISLNLDFKEDGWMIFNTQQTGYYRVNYDVENWRRITVYLNSENYIKIHVLNRAQLIDDAFNLMIMHQLNSSIFWNLTNYLWRETDYVAWYPMFKALEYMSNIFPLPKKEVDIIKKRVQKTLSALLNEIKYNEIDRDEIRICLRQEAAKWACILDDLTCKKEANYKLEQHLINPKMQKLLPWWKEWTFCKGLMTASKTDSIWQTVYHMGMEKSETKFSEFVACSEDTGTIIDSFHMHLRSEQIFAKPKYHINSYLFTIAKHAKNYEVLKHILLNFHEIKPKQVNMIVAITVIINNLYDKDQLNKDIIEFVIEEKNKAKEVAFVKSWEGSFSEKEKINKKLRDVEQLAIKMESKIKIRCDQIDNNINYLQSLV